MAVGSAHIALAGIARDSINTTTAKNITETVKVPLCITTFNCKGFKQSVHYVHKLIMECGILCLQETWLRPHEISFINSALQELSPDLKLYTHAKSAMSDIEANYSGRPFGGVAIICKHNDNMNYCGLPTNGERLTGVGIYDSNGVLIQTVVSVYMPYYNNDPEQAEMY